MLNIGLGTDNRTHHQALSCIVGGVLARDTSLYFGWSKEEPDLHLGGVGWWQEDGIALKGAQSKV